MSKTKCVVNIGTHVNEYDFLMGQDIVEEYKKLFFKDNLTCTLADVKDDIEYLYTQAGCKNQSPAILIIDSPEQLVLLLEYIFVKDKRDNNPDLKAWVDASLKTQDKTIELHDDNWSGITDSQYQKSYSKIYDLLHVKLWNSMSSANKQVVEAEVMLDVNTNIWRPLAGLTVRIGDIFYKTTFEEHDDYALGLLNELQFIACYDYFHRVGSIDSPLFRKYSAFLKKGIASCLTFDDFVIICRTPERVKYDVNSRLHSTDGPAIKWKDGQSEYFLQNIHFTEELFKSITNRTITPQEILALPNIEHRMMALKYYDPQKLLKDMNAELLDTSPRGNKLYAIPGIIQNRILKALVYKDPSTDRVYVSWVEDRHVKADTAMASKWPGLSEEEYARLVREA